MEVKITEDLKIEIRKPKQTRTRTAVPACQRVIDYAREKGDFDLAEIIDDLGLKETCIRTHMSFINSNPQRFGQVIFRRRPKSRVYHMIEG